MPTIQEKILEEFYEKLKESEGFTETMVDEFRNLFLAEKKPKADKLVQVLAGASKETVP